MSRTPGGESRPHVHEGRGEQSPAPLVDEELGCLLHQLTEIAAAVLPGSAGCGITLVRQDHSATTVSSSAEVVEVVDEAQYASNDGPCLHALRTQTPTDVEDTATDRRWPGFTRTARACGIRSSHSEPLTIDRRAVGVLNSYSAGPGAFTGPARRTARLLADHVEVLLRAHLRHLAQTRWHETGRAHRRPDHPAAEPTIDRAVGVLMAQRHCSPDEAHAILRQAAGHTDLAVWEIAARLLAGTAAPGAPEARES
jgi:hypothetical protein